MASLSNRTVLLVEDEFFQAEDLAQALAAEGATVVGPCRNPEEAARHLNDGPSVDLAVIDINLGSGPSFEVADLLTRRGVPFAFATGYGAAVLPPRHADRPRWEKPFDPRELAARLGRLDG